MGGLNLCIHFPISSLINTPFKYSLGTSSKVKIQTYAGEGKVALTTRLLLWFEVEDFVNVFHLAEMENENPEQLFKSSQTVDKFRVQRIGIGLKCILIAQLFKASSKKKNQTDKFNSLEKMPKKGWKMKNIFFLF